MIFALSIHRTIKLLLYTLILMSSIFSCAKNSYVGCQQIEDVVENGQRYMQFVFTDNQGNYTAGYLESYDDPSKGSLFCCMHQNSVKSHSRLHMEQLQEFHTTLIARMKHQAILSSPVTQRQQIDRLCLQGRITVEEAINYYQQIEYASLVAQAQKKAKEARKKDKNKKTSSDQKKTRDVQKKSKVAPEVIQKLFESHNCITKDCDQKDSPFQKVMGSRSKALKSSLKNQMSTSKQFKINRHTKEFLQAQNIDIPQFQQVEGLPIQHQLTDELVGVLDAVADYAQQHQYATYQRNLTKYCAHLASLSQQSNMQGDLAQAIDGTNCCHGIQHYLEGMVSSVGHAYQQFQAALDYFDTVFDTYGSLIVQHGVQGAFVAHGLETIVTAGMIAAPTVTVVATACMIGAAVYVMAPLCAQAMIDTVAFGGACITGSWDKVVTDLDNFSNFLRSPETVARMAELAGGIAMPTPNLNCVVEQILSLRPVITSVQNASGDMVQSLYVMTKNQLQEVYLQGLELLQLPEFVNFNLSYKKMCGFNFFDIVPKNHPALSVAMEGLESGLINSAEQAALTSLFTQAEESIAGNVITLGASSLGSQTVQGILSTDFAATEVGKKMLQAITKPYEEVMFKNITKVYGKLIANQASKETINLFCRCHEMSIVPQKISADIERLHMIFKDKYLGLQEFSSENIYLTMQMRHIFYPSVQPKLDASNQVLEKINLNGFHHDEYRDLEESGLFKFINKVDGEGCFMADLDFGDGIISKGKTFFSSMWSREQTAKVIFEASQNRIEDISDPLLQQQKKYMCKGFNNTLIEIIINAKNVIVSAYPSKRNFRI